MSKEWVFLLGLRSRTRLMSVPRMWYVPLLDALTVRLLVYKLINAHSYLPWIQKKGEVRITNVPLRMQAA